MTPASMPLDDLLFQLGETDSDKLKVILERTVQALIEAEVSAVIKASRHERAEERVTYRNGHRPRSWDTRVGRLELEIPKLRQGSFLPSLLEPRRRIERALWAVIQEAYVHGVSTREVDDLVAAMGGCRVSKSEVSRICQELDQELALFRDRPLDDATYPYVWFDATYEKVRVGGRIVSQAVVIAVGVRETGEKCILGVAVGSSETEAFWLEFCRSLLARGLQGVQLVISDAHQGLKNALGLCFSARSQLAALQGALPAGSGHRAAQARGAGGAGTGEDDLRPAQPGSRQDGSGPGSRTPRAHSSQGCCDVAPSRA